MDTAKWRRRFIQALRIYPLLVLALIGLTFLFGGFSNGTSSSQVRASMNAVALFLIIVAPIGAIIGFYIIGRAGDLEHRKGAINQEKFAYIDAFAIPSEEMHGFKLAFIAGHDPTFAGLTGDTYSADAIAVCSANTEHVPPVVNCECGFYAYKICGDAIFEKSINPNSFLLDVDLYGLGFVHTRGYRAESQVVNSLQIPRRCMRCKIFPASLFVGRPKLGYRDAILWQACCLMCSRKFKTSQKLSIDEMADALRVKIKSHWDFLSA